MLTDSQRRRYARNILLPGIGEAGQEKLLRARVLVIGAGGLGSASITYLAAAGVGMIGIVDADRVELSNLNRQVLFETGDIGRSKTEAARNRVEEVNSEIEVVCHTARLETSNAESIICDYDIVADGCDNFETRFTVHDTCYALMKPLVSAAVRSWEGQLSTFKAYLGGPHPCYHCLVHTLPHREQDCAVSGVLGALTGMLGAMQALEVIKEIVGLSSLSGTLLQFDATAQAWRKIHLPRDPECAYCNGR